MSQTWKVFFACALGAFVGALVALQINHNFWWLGLAVGFGIGYLTYEFKKVIAAIPVAWQAATSWRLNRTYWKNYFRLLIPASGMITTMLIGFAGLFVGLSTLGDKILGNNSAFDGPGFSAEELACGAVFLYGVALVLSLLGLITSPEEKEIFLEQKRIFIAWNPFRVYLWLPPKFLFYLLPRFTWKHRTTIAQGVGVAVRFAKNLFKLIHSELRLLCGVDAAIGAAIGYFCHNALIGAVVGGLWGVLNFEVLSIRILKLVPKSASIFR